MDLELTPTDDGDAYADLEDWYAESFPRLGSTPSFAHLGVVSAVKSPPPTPRRSPFDDTIITIDRSRAEDEESIDDYEIIIAQAEDVVSNEESPVTEGEAVSIIPTDGGADDPAAGDDPICDIPLEFVTKKLVRRGAEGLAIDAEQHQSARRRRCCDRCQSDTNGKLLARCAGCAFARHLYCFNPPLQQHPALVTLKRIPRHQERPTIKSLVGGWRCETCVKSNTSDQRVSDATIQPQGIPSKKNNPKSTTSPTRKSPQRSPSLRNVNSTCSRNNSVESQPSLQSRRSQPSPFNWYAFRHEKYEKVIEGGAGGISELAFYSPSEALLKKTAMFWLRHQQQRRQLRERQQAWIDKCRIPSKRDVMVSSADLTPRELAAVDVATRRRQQEEADAERELFDDAALYRFDDSRPIFQTLRRRPAIISTSAHVDSEANIELRLQRELSELALMIGEDEDAPTPAQALRLAQRRAARAVLAARVADPSLLGLYLATRIIERCVVRWLKHSRQIVARVHIDAELEAMQREEAETILYRRHAARFRNGMLCYTLWFVLALVRACRRRERQREALLVLGDAKEDAQTAATAANAAEARRRLATRRIQRFFLRRVRRYVRMKREVMGRRIRRWWRRRHYAWRWREIALTTRWRHRNRAAGAIQRPYRRYRVREQFRRLFEIHAVRRVRRFLRGWLMRRVIAKERERVALYDAAMTLDSRGMIAVAAELGSRPEAPMSEILLAVGMGLYSAGDAWHAASLLERLGRTSPAFLEAPGARLALAQCHHRTWYESTDPLHLNRAAELLGLELNRDGRSRQRDELDPQVLEELALVLLQREDFVGSLRILGALIELFPDEDGFPLWLLLAGVQLQQLERWSESITYLDYVADLVLPAPYLERDVLALCAMSHERVPGERDAAREAWKAAIRLWTLEKKQLGVVNATPFWSVPVPAGDPRGVSRQRKWELLVDLGQRACTYGHYLVACRALLYALERLPPSEDTQHQQTTAAYEQQRAWWQLGEAFRHLGRFELYVEATARSQDPPPRTEECEDWRRHAELQQRRFQDGLTSTPREYLTRLVEEKTALQQRQQQQEDNSKTRDHPFPAETDLVLEDLDHEGSDIVAPDGWW